MDNIEVRSEKSLEAENVSCGEKRYSNDMLE